MQPLKAIHIVKSHKPTQTPKLAKEYVFPYADKGGRRISTCGNIGFAKWRVKYFYDSLVQGSSSVFQINICAENPPLRKAEKRYRSG